MSPEDFERVRSLNESFRDSRKNVDDEVLWTRVDASLGRNYREAVLKAIREQSDFSHDDVGLHDWGTVRVNNRQIQWQIVYLPPGCNPAEAQHRALYISGE
jgi:hypothetical protein